MVISNYNFLTEKKRSIDLFVKAHKTVDLHRLIKRFNNSLEHVAADWPVIEIV